MKRIVLCVALIVLSAGFGDAAERPNILLVMADDLGYSDLGCYGSEIATPNLDALARSGLRYTQFHNTARCWPTRAALLTGYYPQEVRRDTVPGVPSGGRGVRPKWAQLVPALIKSRGYRSYHSGKWHLDGMPIENGFDHSYYLGDQGRYFNPQRHWEDDVKLPPVEPGTGYYITTAIADHAVKCLKEHAKKYADKPFFHYLAFTAPHFPLQALPEDIARYRNRYREGWDKIRAARWKRVQQEGVASGKLSAVERNIGPPYDFPEAFKILGPGEINRPLPWDSLTPEQKEFQAAKMAVHAAMVDRVDREFGKVLAQLRAMKAFDNTLILFLSDNGASAEIMVRDDGHDPTAAPGSAKTYLCLGPGWSTSSNTPFRRHKTWVHEGGTATPLIAHWPNGIAARGELRHTPGHVIDVVPTILELAGGMHPSTKAGAEFPKIPGQSLVPTFAKDTAASRTFWWAHEGNRAVRVGNWKLVAAKGDPWELYDLSTDRTETNDVAAKYPDKVKQLEAEWEREWEAFQKIAHRDLPETSQNSKPVKELILPGESFRVAGRPAFILWPPKEKRSVPQPWIMYAPTLPAYPDKHEKWMHEQFLDAGIAVAGIDVGEAYGSPASQKPMDALYRRLTRQYGLAKKMCLLGRSRGGLWVSSWAIRNTGKVTGIAGIYPVFDLRSYPGLAKAAPAYGMTPDELEGKLGEFNPIAKASVLAEAKIPVYIIHGDEDKVVPLKLNSAALRAAYEAAGDKQLIQLKVVPGQGHNYWEGFFHCDELIAFAIERARAGAGR